MRIDITVLQELQKRFCRHERYQTVAKSNITQEVVHRCCDCGKYRCFHYGINVGSLWHDHVSDAAPQWHKQGAWKMVSEE